VETVNVRGLAADLLYGARHPWARAGLWACGAAGGLLLVVLALWWPAQRERALLEDKIAGKRREFVQTQQADELLRAYTQARKEVALLEKKLEHAATQSQLVENFARLARKHGVKIISETYEEGRAAGSQPMLNAELSVQGGYPALRDFLHDVSALPTWSEVQEVRLESVQGAATQKGRIRVMTYRRASTERAKPS
jgi:Tfp pilus assembly protein PilO